MTFLLLVTGATCGPKMLKKNEVNIVIAALVYLPSLTFSTDILVFRFNCHFPVIFGVMYFSMSLPLRDM